MMDKERKRRMEDESKALLHVRVMVAKALNVCVPICVCDYTHHVATHHHKDLIHARAAHILLFFVSYVHVCVCVCV
jgi:hypothetical protein